MRIKKLKLGKEIVANLSKSELNEIKGGTYGTTYTWTQGGCCAGSSFVCYTQGSGGGYGCPTYYPCHTNQ